MHTIYTYIYTNTHIYIYILQVVKNNRYWIRTVWEHEISHYIYAVGLCGMYTLQQWLYRNVKYVPIPIPIPIPISLSDNTSTTTSTTTTNANPNQDTDANTEHYQDQRCLFNCLILSSSLFHGFIIAGAAINFPSGIVTGMLYVGIGLCLSIW